jgi:sterol desaturase/sphingolipid hydroxylase (fatty acid hydroxylase superfamily)
MMNIILYCFLPQLLFIFGYLLLSVIFFIFDIFVIKTQDQIFKYKIQKKGININEYKMVFPTVFRNLFVTTIINTILSYIMIKNKIKNNQVPDFHFIYEIINLGLGIFIHEIIFFSGHLLFHKNKLLYKIIHKEHHKINSPFAIAALYMSLIEALFIIVVCTQIPNYIFGYHYITACVYVSLALMFFIASHSGYGKYTLISQSRHDLHHKYYNVNYSNLSIIDKMMGTNRDR